ncbi:hypothetical protein Pla52n_44060 [Stieleria varia]|uniref:Uncharacterized protein n=1 Tax=Stieleria varia TaxID=2528005 RepID=A0A5C6ALZ4_9BACT|nr:hypothetical protein Pla52n_44060 [Stieleria varia]
MECGRPDTRIICCHWIACDGPASAFDFDHIVGGAKSGAESRTRFATRSQRTIQSSGRIPAVRCRHRKTTEPCDGTERRWSAIRHGCPTPDARTSRSFCRYSARSSRVDVAIDHSNELADLVADSMLLASAMRPLAELLRVKWSAVDRMFESSVAIGTRVTVRPQHSTSATSSAGRKQERIQGSNCRAVEKGGTIQRSHPGGRVPPRNTTEPCVGPKRRIGRMNMETTMASLGQRHRSSIEATTKNGPRAQLRFLFSRRRSHADSRVPVRIDAVPGLRTVL